MIGCRKLNLQPANDVSPDHGALSETVIQINGQQSWLRRQSRNHQISPHTAV
jgi:transposase-like protein